MEGLEQEIDSLLEQHGVPLCSVVAVNKDGVVWKSAFGENSSSSETTTQFHLFSGTKLYTATAVMRLVEDKRLSLDDMVTKHLPDFDEYLDGITIEHLLGHASGLADTPMQAWLSANFRSSTSTNSPPSSSSSSLDTLKRFNFKRMRAPGKYASYGNINYVILGEVIERVTGQKYQDYVRETILVPLGSNACFTFRDAPNLTNGWVGYWNSLMTKMIMESDQYHLMFEGTRQMEPGKRGAGMYSLTADFNVDCLPIGGLVGTVEDFAPLVVEFLRHASSNNKDTTGSTHSSSSKPVCLSSTGMKTMVNHHFQGKIGVHSKDGVGLGWKIGKDFVNHEGGGPGFTSETRCYLEDGIGVIVMMNKWSIMYKECTICHEICELVRKAVIINT